MTWYESLNTSHPLDGDLAVKAEENCGLDVLLRSNKSLQFWKTLAILFQSARSFIDNSVEVCWLPGACHLPFFYQFFKLLDDGPFSLNLVEAADDDKWNSQK
ncbi:hypothetical protein BOTNAR_2039g00010 [Botryotinia narcissicola]|uniref:Uncharacterized protein n=1 Tax=Botryotinia narcissicola TaxID=278944 RepID=A0A4Z1H457_9HELO|nr:hypothetical protein BOTNAR_2039g00010 [Botryotinia narcissicola]